MSVTRPKWIRSDRMQPAEFERLCESVYGALWRRAAARVLGRDPKMMARYATGDTVIPEDVAQRLREHTEISPVAASVKQVILAAAEREARRPKMREKISGQQKAHFLSLEIAAELERVGLVIAKD